MSAPSFEHFERALIDGVDEMRRHLTAPLVDVLDEVDGLAEPGWAPDCGWRLWALRTPTVVVALVRPGFDAVDVARRRADGSVAVVRCRCGEVLELVDMSAHESDVAGIPFTA